MRILYILSGTEIKGGATKSFLTMADAVAAAGNELAVVVPDEKGVTPVLREKGWKVLAVSYDFCALPRLSWSARDIIRFIPRLARIAYLNLRARRKVIRFAKEWNADLIHDNTSVIDLGHYAAKRLGIPHVVHVREYAGWRDFRLIFPGLENRIKSPNTYLAAITSDLARFRGEKVAEDHVRTIYNGIVKDIPKDYIIVKEPYFFYAGRIVPAKGVDDMVDAYVKYASETRLKGKEPLKLVVAGKDFADKFAEGLTKKIKDSGLDDYVEWLGEIDNVNEYYSKAVATVIPSLIEGFGRVMPEAMAAGSLCIARKSRGLAEQLENGRRETGKDIAFGFDTADELAGIFTSLDETYSRGDAFAEGSELRRMIDDSRKVVGALYTCQANGRNVLDYYSYIIDRQGKHNENKDD